MQESFFFRDNLDFLLLKNNIADLTTINLVMPNEPN
jgi:hypothetical protein